MHYIGSFVYVLVVVVSLSFNMGHALEISAGKSSDATANSAFASRIEVIKAALETAFNDLKATVDTFEARIASLESWRTTMNTWKTSTVDPAITNVNYLYNTWMPWVNGQLSSQDKRLDNLEKAKYTATVKTTSCKNYKKLDDSF